MLGLTVGILLVGSLGAAVPALPVSLSLPYMIAAVLMAAAIGLAAGLAPANHAAGLDPLTALRSRLTTSAGKL